MGWADFGGLTRVSCASSGRARVPTPADCMPGGCSGLSEWFYVGDDWWWDLAGRKNTGLGGVELGGVDGCSGVAGLGDGVDPS